MTRRAAYFIRVNSWQGGRDWWVGPFSRREDAENAIASAESRPDADMVQPGVSAQSAKNAVRVNEIASRTDSVRNGMADGCRRRGGDNRIGRRVPATLDELHEMSSAVNPF